METKAAKNVVFFTFSCSMLLELNVCFYSSGDGFFCEYATMGYNLRFLNSCTPGFNTTSPIYVKYSKVLLPT